MNDENKRFLIDSNSLLTPFKTYYPFDLAERFWSNVSDKIKSGNIVILDLVREELRKGEDELTDWINSFNDEIILSRVNTEILQKYGEVLTHVQESDFYKNQALLEWSDASVADPMLIAVASVHGFCIVTFEKPNNNLSRTHASKNPKIPDVANVFGVECCDLFSMMRNLSVGL